MLANKRDSRNVFEILLFKDMHGYLSHCLAAFSQPFCLKIKVK